MKTKRKRPVLKPCLSWAIVDAATGIVWGTRGTRKDAADRALDLSSYNQRFVVCRCRITRATGARDE